MRQNIKKRKPNGIEEEIIHFQMFRTLVLVVLFWKHPQEVAGLFKSVCIKLLLFLGRKISDVNYWLMI
jgi:hypothetical protein